MAAASRALHVWQYEWFISICLKSGNTKPLVAKWPCCFKDIFIYIYIYIIHELPSITIFLSWVMWFARVKIIGKSHHEWQKKSLFTVTNVLLNFAYAILCPEYIILLKESSVAHFAIVAKESLFWLSIVTSHSWSVTSHEREVLVLWRHIRRLFLHAQIGKNNLH